MPPSLVRATYDFRSDESGDLNFSADDVIEVVRWVNEQWIFGRLGTDEGMFPSNFVESVTLPTCQSSECLLIVTKNFAKEEARDLAITRGQVVVGIRSENPDWWFGRSGASEGIFPASHVRRVTGGSPTNSSNANSGRGLPQAVRARAVSDLKGQIDGELSFSEGDPLEVVRVVDDVFCEGICRGEYGLFPLHVVQILQPDQFEALQTWCKDMATSSRKPAPAFGSASRSRSSTGNRSFTTESASTPDVVVEAYGKAIAPFVGENSDELTVMTGDLVKLISHVDKDWTYGEMAEADGSSRRGIFPTRFVDIIVDCPYDERARIEEDGKGDGGAMYGVVKYNFFGDRSDDLHITQGDRVRLIRWVDENWCEAEDDSGNVGQCPTSYLELEPLRAESRQAALAGTAEERRERFSFATCTNLSLDQAIANEMRRAQLSAQSRLLQRPLSCYEPSTTEGRSSPPPSSFEAPPAATAGPRPTLRKRPAPPRPLEPEVFAARAKPLQPEVVPPPRPLQPEVTPRARPNSTSSGEHKQMKPVPRRPVPPRPVPSAAGAEKGENETIMNDLQKRIFSIEDNIKELTAASEIPINEESSGESIEGNLSSLRKDLQFYQDKLSEVRGDAPRVGENEIDMRAKRAKQRANVLAELVSTERNYLGDLRAMAEVFLDSGMSRPEVDVNLLFGNLHDVIALSQRLLTSLQANESPGGNIGQVFLEYREEMVQVYVEYCKNHEDAVKMLQRLDPPFQAFVADGLRRMQIEQGIFSSSLDGLVIKPVQRVLKYPLLLHELLKSTEESAPDHTAIGKAVLAMTEAVQEINELKRRKDLVQKYLRPQAVDSAALSISQGMHSLRKKGARLSQRLSTTLGFKTHTIDEDFNREEARFRNCEKCLKVFLRDVHAYSDAMKEYLSGHTVLCNDMHEFCADSDSTAETMARAFLEAYIRTMDSFKNVTMLRIENRVLIPLYKLQSLFQGPNKLIKKRYDKMLDYDNLTHTMKKARESGQVTRPMSDALDKAAKIYEAMNDQLKEELPQLNALSWSLLHECIANFVQLATSMAENGLQEIRSVLQASSGLSEHVLSCRDIHEAFLSQHTAQLDRMARLSFLPKGFAGKETTMRFSVPSEELASPSRSSARCSQVAEPETSAQLPEHRSALTKNNPPDSLFMTLLDVLPSSDPLALSLHEGDLVAVIKRTDPMGNASRWYVDNGIRKGFVPASVLNPYTSPPPYAFAANTEGQPDLLSAPTTVWYVNLDQGLFTDPDENESSAPAPAHSHYEEIDEIDVPERRSPTPPPAVAPEREVREVYRALYTFDARNTNEMSLHGGQLLQVLQKHDYSGNQEWWLVQADDRQGYVPSYYVQPL